MIGFSDEFKGLILGSFIFIWLCSMIIFLSPISYYYWSFVFKFNYATVFDVFPLGFFIIGLILIIFLGNVNKEKELK